jgi:hypothetical protein
MIAQNTFSNEINQQSTNALDQTNNSSIQTLNRTASLYSLNDLLTEGFDRDSESAPMMIAQLEVQYASYPYLKHYRH